MAGYNLVPSKQYQTLTNRLCFELSLSYAVTEFYTDYFWLTYTVMPLNKHNSVMAKTACLYGGLG